MVEHFVFRTAPQIKINVFHVQCLCLRNTLTRSVGKVEKTKAKTLQKHSILVNNLLTCLEFPLGNLMHGKYFERTCLSLLLLKLIDCSFVEAYT